MADDTIPRIKADISLFEVKNDISYLGLDERLHPKLLVNPSTVLPFFEVHSEGFVFRVAFKDNIVRAVFVSKPLFSPLIRNSFKTPEGVFIGMSYRELLELVPDIKISERSYWAYEGILLSGWKIGFITGPGQTDYFPNPEDTINMIYKE